MFAEGRIKIVIKILRMCNLKKLKKSLEKIRKQQEKNKFKEIYSQNNLVMK